MLLEFKLVIIFYLKKCIYIHIHTYIRVGHTSGGQYLVRYNDLDEPTCSFLTSGSVGGVVFGLSLPPTPSTNPTSEDVSPTLFLSYGPQLLLAAIMV